MSWKHRRTAGALVVSRLAVHGEALTDAIAEFRHTIWVGKRFPYRMSAGTFPFLLLVTLLGLFQGYRSMSRGGRPVVIVQFVSLDAIPAYFFRRVTGCKVVLYAIGSDILGKRRPGQNAFLRWVVGRADLVLCVSGAVEGVVRNLGCSRTRVLPSAYRGIRVAGAGEKEFDVVAVGALIPLKRHGLLIDSCAELHRRVRVAIVGGGPLMASLRSRASVLPSVEVSWFGQTPRVGVFDVLSRSRVFVHCSAYEGVPTALLEAASVGIPIVAVSADYVEELVRVHGFAIDIAQEASPKSLASAMESVFDDYEAASARASGNRSGVLGYAAAWSRKARAFLEELD